MCSSRLRSAPTWPPATRAPIRIQEAAAVRAATFGYAVRSAPSSMVPTQKHHRANGSEALILMRARRPASLGVEV
jgi:hypothetical protein